MLSVGASARHLSSAKNIHLKNRFRPFGNLYYRQCLSTSVVNQYAINAGGNYPRGQLTSMSAHPLAERLPKFREMAAEARQSALCATSPEMRREYEGLAQ